MGSSLTWDFHSLEFSIVLGNDILVSTEDSTCKCKCIYFVSCINYHPGPSFCYIVQHINELHSHDCHSSSLGVYIWLQPTVFSCACCLLLYLTVIFIFLLFTCLCSCPPGTSQKPAEDHSSPATGLKPAQSLGQNAGYILGPTPFKPLKSQIRLLEMETGAVNQGLRRTHLTPQRVSIALSVMLTAQVTAMSA